jgi:hypothetical protein
MGVPTSEVGYTSATARRGDHEISYEHVGALGGEKIYIYIYIYTPPPVPPCHVFNHPSEINAVTPTLKHA